MKSKDIARQLVPGLIAGFILGFILITIVGVDEGNEIPNIIGAVMSCAVPCLLNGVIVLKGTAKTLERKLSIGKALVMNIPYIILAAIIGFLYSYIYMKTILGFNLCALSPMQNTIIFASLGAVVSTILAYVALKDYEKRVKYTRREK